MWTYIQTIVPLFLKHSERFSSSHCAPTVFLVSRPLLVKHNASSGRTKLSPEVRASRVQMLMWMSMNLHFTKPYHTIPCLCVYVGMLSPAVVRAPRVQMVCVYTAMARASVLPQAPICTREAHCTLHMVLAHWISWLCFTELHSTIAHCTLHSAH